MTPSELKALAKKVDDLLYSDLDDTDTYNQAQATLTAAADVLNALAATLHATTLNNLQVTGPGLLLRLLTDVQQIEAP